MENHGQYIELARYLKAVRCHDVLSSGDIHGGALALFYCYYKTCCIACHLSLSHFEMYLKIFRTGHVPSGKEMEKSSRWISVGTPLRVPFLLIQILKLVCSNSSLYKNPQYWSAIIRTFSSHSILGEDGSLLPLEVKQPPRDFQEMIISESCHVVKEATIYNRFRDNIFPKKVYSRDTYMEVGLIFVVQLVRQMIVHNHHSMTSFLDVVLAFGKNIWALRLLLESLTHRDNTLRTIVGLTITELQSRKAEMLVLWNHFGPWYVCELLYLFLSSSNRNIPSIAIIITNIIKENLAMCLWAKQVGEFLQKSRRHFAWVPPDVSSFIAASQTLS
ncbi:uncharacterized protein LOC121937496 isoform X2 [Sceloporus undulatus]|uniref:uncharacterized protein LOC121937496 isoform X2 n=1 Tax=Sceloporus undulatus TaxID=8520 RepID=UPI001C4BFABC|nr:uncharacterized protein LOC121937496 isoform X2 [Sceloporus undulatus]